MKTDLHVKYGVMAVRINETSGSIVFTFRLVAGFGANEKGAKELSMLKKLKKYLEDKKAGTLCLLAEREDGEVGISIVSRFDPNEFGSDEPEYSPEELLKHQEVSTIKINVIPTRNTGTDE